MTIIVNKMFTTGIFPTSFKSALITPIYKNGSLEQMINYRPIPVIQNLAKHRTKAGGQ